jgi:glycosyltransferase involved in cell wall biosynthesis
MHTQGPPQPIIETEDSRETGVDDGSTDSSAEIVSGVADDRVRLCRQDNRGIAAARNVTISKSAGRFIAFLDQDDLWHPEKLARQMPLFLGAPRVGLVYCQSGRVGGDSEEISAGPKVLASWMSGDVRRRMLLGNLVPGTAGVVVRRECFEEVGLFDETLNGSDDWEMWARIAARYEFRYVPRALSFTRLHSANTSLDVSRMRDQSLRVRAMLFSDPELTRGIGFREKRRLHERATARIHSYCATWLLRSGRYREAARDLAKAVRHHPGKPRHAVLLLFALLGWMPRCIERRLI